MQTNCSVCVSLLWVYMLRILDVHAIMMHFVSLNRWHFNWKTDYLAYMYYYVSY